jgi:hypothetical protein
MCAQAGPAAGIQTGVAIDHQQARHPAQVIQDRAQRRQLAQVELARPAGRKRPSKVRSVIGLRRARARVTADMVGFEGERRGTDCRS